MQEKVAIIIISYKTSHLIGELVSTIRETMLDVAIYVLDNGSTDETYAQLQEIRDSRIRLVQSRKNLGFTGGINYTLKEAVKNDDSFDYFFLLNPDAFCIPDLISNLAVYLKDDPKAACASPRILHVNGSSWYSGATVDRLSGRVNNNATANAPAVPGIPYEVDVFSGCAALFRLKMVQAAGMFNESLFMYYDEADMSMKLKQLGYKILYVPHLTVYHDVSYTTRNISHLKTYYMTRNKLLVFGKTMPVTNKIYYVFYELAYYLKNRRFKNAVYHIRGLLDYMRGRYGAAS
jgi:GT2 family glycosyltransferase